MIPDLEVWQCAAMMIKRFGDLADLEAATRADEFQAKGDLDGQRVWLRILKAIDALQKAEPGETKH